MNPSFHKPDFLKYHQRYLKLIDHYERISSNGKLRRLTRSHLRGLRFRLETCVRYLRRHGRAAVIAGIVSASGLVLPPQKVAAQCKFEQIINLNSSFSVSGSYVTPELADIDNDGDLDLIYGRFNGTIDLYENIHGYLYRNNVTNPFTEINVGLRPSPSFGDIDGDGDLDLIVGNLFFNIKYFKNSNGVFNQVQGASNPFDGIFVGNSSTPSFGDIDRDGDLDVIVGQSDGSIKYFKNVNGIFNEVQGASSPFDGVSAGGLRSSPSLGDIDGDGDLDLIVGDFDGNIKYFKNVNGVFSEVQGVSNPFDGINVVRGASPIFGDIDGDGDLDLIVGNHVGNIHYFKNVNGVFNEVLLASNLFNGIDVGSRSSPIFGDIDGDGDSDVIIGNGDGNIKYFKNVGGTFNEIQGASNPFDGANAGLSVSPIFGDLDGDGDLDFIVGNEDGDIKYFKNTNGVFSEVQGASNPFDGANAGLFVSPIFGDIDRDGDLDLIVGNEDGDIKYFKNVNGVFSEVQGASNPFDGIVVGDFSSPSLEDIDGDGDLDAYIGEGGGTIKFFQNNNGVFSEVTSDLNPLVDIDVGRKARPSFADLDGDGSIEAIIGASDGQLLVLESSSACALTPCHFIERFALGANPFEDINIGLKSSPVLIDYGNDDRALFVSDEQTHSIRTFFTDNSAFAEQTGFNNPFNGVSLMGDAKITKADYDGDGDLDLIIVDYEVTNNTTRVRLFKSEGIAFVEQLGNDNPFKDLFDGLGLNFPGESDYPSLALSDWDGDNDLDAFIGVKTDSDESLIYFFENDGSNLYSRQDLLNPFDGVTFPTISQLMIDDIDGDNEEDAIVGLQNGKILFFKKNINLFGQSVLRSYLLIDDTTDPFDNIDVGSFATLDIEDIDGDGRKEVIFGNFAGNIKYFKPGPGCLPDPVTIPCGSNEWTGSPGGNSHWNVSGANWSLLRLPMSCDDVIIPAGNTTIVRPNNTAEGSSIEIQQNATLKARIGSIFKIGPD